MKRTRRANKRANSSSPFFIIYDASRLIRIFQDDDPSSLSDFIIEISSKVVLANDSSDDFSNIIVIEEEIDDRLLNVNIQNNLLLKRKKESKNGVYNEHTNLPKCLKYSPFLIDVAAYYGAVECLRYFLVRSSIESINHTDLKGRTIAHFAAYNGSVEAFRLIQEVGFDLIATDAKGKTAVEKAVKYGRLSAVKYLCTITPFLSIQPAALNLNQNQNNNNQNNNNQNNNNQNNNNLNNNNLNNNNPNNNNLNNNNLNNNNLNINNQDNNNLNNNLNNDIQNNIQDNNNNNQNNNVNNNQNNKQNNDLPAVQYLLHTAASSCCPIETIKFIMDFGNFDLCIPDPLNGLTFFSKAIDTQNKDLLVLLLDRSTEQLPDSFGLYPIHRAAIQNNSEFIELLLDFGADINTTIQNSKKLTSLHLACQKGCIEAVSTLLCNKELKINAVDSKGRTAMHYAAKMGRVDIVEILYDFNADPEIYDKTMLTPMNLAYLSRTKAGCLECLNFFREIGLECDNEDLIRQKY